MGVDVRHTAGSNAGLPTHSLPVSKAGSSMSLPAPPFDPAISGNVSTDDGQHQHDGNRGIN